MNCSSQPPYDVSVHPAFSKPVQKYPATCWEIVLAFFSSLITGAYTLHHNENQGVSQSMFEQQILGFITGPFSFILDPHPAMLLVCCVILGSSVSSFIYRRQEQDKFQTRIFLFVMAAAIASGLGSGTNYNLVMLVFVPLGLCFAMVFSLTVLCLLERRWRRKSQYVYEIDRKGGV